MEALLIVSAVAVATLVGMFLAVNLIFFVLWFLGRWLAWLERWM